jgi:hypothetical protein
VLDYKIIDFSFLKKIFDELCTSHDISMNFMLEINYLDGLSTKSVGVMNFIKFMKEVSYLFDLHDLIIHINYIPKNKLSHYYR